MLKYKKLVYMAFFLLFSFLLVVKAEGITSNPNCTMEEQQRLRQIVNATKISYEFKEYQNYDGTTNKAYKLTINNFTNDFYIWNEERGLYITYNGSNIAYIDGLMPNTTYQLPFYASNNSPCSDSIIMTKLAYLPPYNYYSEDPLCKGYEDYELCRKYSPISIGSYEEFVSRMQDYIKKQKPNDNNNNEEEKPTNGISLWDKIANFLIDNILYITIPIIVLGTSLIIVVEVRRRRSIL